jgi:hypothetical protein
MVRWLALAALLGTAAGASGCALFGMAAETVAGGKIPAKHTLAEQTTLVMVDDPKRQLPQPGMPRLVASNVRFHLKKNSNLTGKMLVSVDKLTQVQRELGEDYPNTPIATVGRRAGAKQVIHVLIRSTRLKEGGSIYQPQAVSEVKVIDATTGERRFPKGDQQVEGLGPSGQLVKTQLLRRRVDRSQRGSRVMLQRALAKRIGLDVARLFYRHSEEPPGHQLRKH